jgi:hypothetical protein
MEPRGVLEQSCANTGLYLGNGIAQLLHNCLTLKGLNSITIGSSGHDDERDDCGLALTLLEAVIETSKGLNEHIDALVTVLIPTGCEHLVDVISWSNTEERHGVHKWCFRDQNRSDHRNVHEQTH